VYKTLLGRTVYLVGTGALSANADFAQQAALSWEPCRQQYVKGLVTVAAPFGGTTDQAITVRLGAVEWNINEWVENPLSSIAKELAAHAQVGWGCLQGH
jgi:hypothetical protein